MSERMGVHFHRRASSVGLRGKWFPFIFICILRDDKSDVPGAWRCLSSWLPSCSCKCFVFYCWQGEICSCICTRRQRNVILELTDVMIITRHETKVHNVTWGTSYHDFIEQSWYAYGFRILTACYRWGNVLKEANSGSGCKTKLAFLSLFFFDP